MTNGLIIGVCGVAVVVMAFAALTASAASLGGAQARTLSAGYGSISSCDGDGVTVIYKVATGAVQNMTVADVAPSCQNGTLRAVLLDSAGAGIGTVGPASVSGSSVTAPVSPQPPAGAVAAVHVSIVGP
ncbi:MAG: hypothetical protein GEU74_06105 [Nitriliruptorales bacterium]|nr:hypothetical protein [Nitriliruptorales bacterium]